MQDNSQKHWGEGFRIITPILVTICLFFLGLLLTQVSRIDEKLFKHLTNDDLHTPRSMVVSQEAFTLYQTMRDKQMDDIKVTMQDIKRILDKRIDIR